MDAVSLSLCCPVHAPDERHYTTTTLRKLRPASPPPSIALFFVLSSLLIHLLIQRSLGTWGNLTSLGGLVIRQGDSVRVLPFSSFFGHGGACQWRCASGAIALQADSSAKETKNSEPCPGQWVPNGSERHCETGQGRSEPSDCHCEVSQNRSERSVRHCETGQWRTKSSPRRCERSQRRSGCPSRRCPAGQARPEATERRCSPGQCRSELSDHHCSRFRGAKVPQCEVRTA